MRIINAHLDLLAASVKLDWTVWPANPALRVNQACPVLTHRFHCHPMDDAVGVHLDHPARLDHQVQLDQAAPKVNQAMAVQMAKKVVLEDQATQEALANPVKRAHLAHQAMLAVVPKLEVKAITDQPVPKANPALAVPTANVEDRANQARPVYQALQVLPVLVAKMETKAPQVHVVRPAVLAKMLNIVLAREGRRRKRKSRKLKYDATSWRFILLFTTQFIFDLKEIFFTNPFNTDLTFML